MKVLTVTVFFLLIAGSCFSQETEESWNWITGDSVLFKIPSKEVKKVRTGVKNLTDRKEYTAFFINKNVIDYSRYKSRGTRIECGVEVFSGTIDMNKLSDHAKQIKEHIKNELLSLPHITLIKDEIITEKSETSIHLSFTGIKEFMTILVKVTANRLILLSASDVSKNGKETAYFINEFKYTSTQVPEFDAKPDTLLYKKYGQYLYITTDTASKLYTYIIPKPDVDKIKESCLQYVAHIKKTYTQKVSKHNLQDFPRKWNEVYELERKLYLYAPSDWLSNSGYYISDSTVLIANSDFNLFVLRDFNRENGVYKIETIDYSGAIRKFEIKPSRPELGIYFWIIKVNDRVEAIRLMQDSKYAKKLPMVVNTCVTMKCRKEVVFNRQIYIPEK